MKKGIAKQLFSLFLCLLLILGFSTTAFAAETGTTQLREPDSSGNVPFAVENMFPGDAETLNFTVKVSHKNPITLYYHADIRPGYEKLAEVLMVKIELPEKNITLYDGLMRDMPSALEHQLAASEKELVYRITAYLETSVGNDYQFKELVADFRWWYTSEEGGGTGPDTPDEPDKPAAAHVKLAAEKVLDGQYPRGKDFLFVLTDENGNNIQTVQNRDGIIEFDTLSFEKEGVYTYFLREQIGSGKFQYDASTYKATVTVTRQNDRYTAAVTWEKDGEDYLVLPRFVNHTKGSTGDGPDQPENPTVPTKPDDPTKPADPVTPIIPDNPKTGDNTNIGLYMAICGISLSAVFVLLLLLLRRKKEEEEV